MGKTPVSTTMMLFGLCLLVPSTSLAGTYQVSACTNSKPSVNNSWTPFNSEPAHLETAAHCGINEITGANAETSGLAAADILEQSTQTPQGAVAGWTFTAPSGDIISAISMNRDLFENSEGWLPQIVDATETALPGESCPYDGSRCELSGAASQTGLDTTSLSIDVLCAPTPPFGACGGGAFLHGARAELDGATVTITDEQPPQVTSASGPLFTGALVRGTITGTVNGTDNSGVQYARLYVDGALAGQQMSSCDFSLPAPCPTTSSNQFSVNTSTLADGPHTIQAALVDVAGNQTLGPAGEISVDNSSPSAPTALAVDGQGTGAWINQPATITWTNPSQPQDDPIAQINWIACLGSETGIPAKGCDDAHSQTSPLTSLTFNPAQDGVFSGAPEGVYTVFVWAQDAVGNTSQANAAAITFGYQTSPPPPPKSITASGDGPYTITVVAPAHLAPITATNWSVCNSGGTCTSTQTSTGLSFVFEPNHTPQFEHAPYTKYTVRAWLQDAAGNSNPANSATVAIIHDKPSPNLRILGMRRTRRALHVRGSAARALTKRVKVVVHYVYRAHRRSTQRTVRVARGKWTAVLRLPRGALATRVTVLYHRSKRWSGQAVTRHVHHVSRRGGQHRTIHTQ
jgi:hypothetical protein